MRIAHWLVVLSSGVACAVSCGGEEPQPISPPVVLTPSATASATTHSAPVTPPKEDASLTARKIFFSNPDRTRVTVSPDGKSIAFLANDDAGVLNVFVASATDPSKAKAVTQEKVRNLRMYHWAYDGKHILYQQDKDGDENWRVYSADIATGTSKEIVAIDGVQARIEAMSHRKPNEIIVAMNDRDKKAHDLYLVDLGTNKRKLLEKNEAGYAGYVVDDDLAVRFAVQSKPDGSQAFLAPDAKHVFQPFMDVPMEDTLTTEPVDFDKAGKHFFMKDSRGRNAAALVSIDLATKKSEVLAEDKQADVADVVIHPTEKKVQAVESVFDRARWQVLDKAIQPDFDYLKTVQDGDLTITSRSLDDKRWIVAYLTEGPTKYYRYDRDAKKPTATFLFSGSKALEGVKLAKMVPQVIKSRDGLDLVSYLTVADATAAAKKPAPMVLFVHGGPWARDTWGSNPSAQWLASRGYAVLQVNYRGSTGFGKKFVNAGDKEWAAKMHDDLLDAVKWAIDQKIADPGKVAIMGGSYGGYATLVGLTFTPDTFACGVDIVGPSNLVTLLETIPPYWTTEIEQFTKRIGDHRTEDGKKFLVSRSPISKVEAIKKPLLIGQGKNDPRVKQAESDQIVSAMQKKNIPVTYVLYPDEGHGFNRAENRMSFYAVSEIFLAQCLGGTFQPIGDDFKGSKITVPAGKDRIFSLEKALP
jgi:dipeptidyl aminopeptidase/acylaminoacyl peptidase